MKILALSLCLVITVSIGLTFVDLDDTSSPATSYYHWANSYTHDDSLLKAYPPERLYLKWLDIGSHQGKVRIHQTQIDSLPNIPVTPVVFLDQRVLKQQSTDQLIKTLLDRIPPTQHRSLQMDCDWTGSTRDLYFQLLAQLKLHYDDLSVTLRLHQIKYSQRTGTPPAHRGVLMYYNMSDVQDPDTKNYVLDNKVGARYLQNFASYSLPLDLALPLYQQTRVIRQHKLVQLISSTMLNTAKTKRLTESKDSPAHSRYQVTQAHYWQGYYLYQDDELVIDTVTEDDLMQTANLLAPMLNPREIIYYKWRDAKRLHLRHLKLLQTLSTNWMTNNMLNTLRHFTTGLALFVCLLPATLYAGGGDWNSPFYTDNGFNILHKDMVKTYVKRSSSLSPHNFNSEEYEESRLTEQYNLAAWAEYLKTTPKIAKDIVYSSNENEASNSENKHPDVTITPAVQRYLTIVHQQEEVVSGGVPYWLSKEEKKQAIKQRRTHRNESIQAISKQLKTETDAFLRQRYVYLLLRLHHYSGRYQEVVDLYQQYSKDISSPQKASNKEVTHWINLLKAGALQRLGKRAESAYLFATTFEQTATKQLQAQINFKIKTDEEWETLLSLSRNNDEKALMHFMRATRTNANSLQELQAIYRIAPDSEWFDNLLIRELEFVQFARQRVFGFRAGGSREVLNKQILIDAISVVSQAKVGDQTVMATQAQRRTDYLEQLSAFLTQVQQDKKRSDLYLSNYAALYLKLLSGQALDLSEVKAFQQEYAQDSRLPYANGLDYLVYLESLDAIDRSAEKIISSKVAAIEALNKDADGKPIYNDDIMVYTYIKLEPLYFKTGQAGKYYIAKARGLVDDDEILIGEIRGLEVLKKTSSPNLLEQRMLTAFSQRGEQDSNQMIARKYLSAGLLEQAEQALKKSDTKDTETTHYNPFITGRSGNNRHLMTAADIKAIEPEFTKEQLTRTEVISRLRTTQAALKQDLANANLHFRLGTAYYNMTWFGNSPLLLRAYRSTYTWVNGEIDLSKARNAYEQALKYSKDRELNAKTLYALAKIEENELYIQQKKTKLNAWIKADNYRGIVRINKKLGLGEHFKQLTAFEDTQYFNDVIKQCADYRYYFDN